MKPIYTTSFLLTTILFCSTALFAQSNKSQTPPIPKDPRLSWQVKSDSTAGAVPNFHFQLNPSVTTKPNTSGGKIIDGADVHVFPSPNPQSEVHISINHKDPNNLLASANTLLGADKGRLIYNQGYYYSWDGGQHWSGADFMQATPLNYVLGDPSTAFAANGTAFLTSIGFDIYNYSYTYWFQKSANGGDTWSHSKSGIDYQTFGFDKQMIAADNEKRSPYANNFYDAYTDFDIAGGEIVFNRSTDLGRTFSSPIIIRNQIKGFGQGANVQTGPNGEVYVCWADHNSVVYPYRADALGFARSLDGGASFTTSRRVFDYSGTRTFGDDPTYNYIRTNDFPAMAVDKSTGWHKGRIYVTYSAFSGGDMTKSVIQVRSSDDKGNTWSAPMNVSLPRASQAFFPWIATDDTNGDVWVVYFAFDTKKAYETNTYVALSTDGGATWENQKVSDVSHITEAINNNYFAYGYEGDYIGITAYSGKAYPAWQDQRNGTWQVYVSPVSKANMQKVITDNVTLQVSPNPFNGNINYSLPKGTISKIELVNASGMVIKRWEHVSSNSLNVADVQRGSYVLKVTTADAKVYSQTILKE